MKARTIGHVCAAELCEFGKFAEIVDAWILTTRVLAGGHGTGKCAGQIAG